MPAQIPIPVDAIKLFCKRHDIVEFALFGSVLRDDFGPDSDIDVLVRFSPEASNSLFDIVHMQDELAGLLGRKVDFVQEPGLVNPFRRHEILRTREVIYAA